MVVAQLLYTNGRNAQEPQAPANVPLAVEAPGPTGTPNTQAAGFPGAADTGVPAGVVLQPSGSVRITQRGQVVDGLDITGCVVIAADDVVIRNTRVRCADAPRKRAVVSEGTRSGLVLEDSEVIGSGSTEIGVDVSGITIRRVEVTGVVDGVRLGSNIVLEDSWVHGLRRSGTLHPDAVQGISAQDVVIRGNTLDGRGADGRDLGNSAIMLGSETGTKLSRNVLVEGNHLDGGNYSLNISTGINAQDFVVRDNVFGKNSRYGPALSPPRVRLGTGNTTEAGTPAKITYRNW